MAVEEAIDVARSYHRAWTSGDFDEVGRRLADDLDVEVPINEYGGGAEFLEAVRGFAQVVKQVDTLAEFGAGDEAMLLYDMVTEPIGVMRVAEHFTVRDGRIVRIRQIHDTAALRAAGF